MFPQQDAAAAPTSGGIGLLGMLRSLITAGKYACQRRRGDDGEADIVHRVAASLSAWGRVILQAFQERLAAGLILPALGAVAKMDAWIVEMTLISIPYGEAAEVCKETTC
jgi:hypothetical protein